jgi:hypothetical protein
VTIERKQTRPLLLAIEAGILRCDDLPVVIPLKPGVGPNQAAGLIVSIFGFPG